MDWGRKEEQGKFWNMEHFLGWAALGEWASVCVPIASKGLRGTEKYLYLLHGRQYEVENTIHFIDEELEAER